MKLLLQQFLSDSLTAMFGRSRPTTDGKQRSPPRDKHPGIQTSDCKANATSPMTSSSVDISSKHRDELVVLQPSTSVDTCVLLRGDDDDDVDADGARSSLTLRRNINAPSWSSGFETSSSVLSLSFQSSGPPSPDLESIVRRTPLPTSRGPPDSSDVWSVDASFPELLPTSRRSSIDTVTSLAARDDVNVAPWLRDVNENASESSRMSDCVAFGDDRPASVMERPSSGRGDAAAAVAGAPRTINEISSSLAANIARLGRDRRAVDEAFGKARSEERIKTRELANIRRQVAEARRQILIATLRRLSGELSEQGTRLQTAYDTVLANRWRQMNASQDQQSS